MKFYISFKYSILSIIKSKLVLIIGVSFLSLIFLTNLIFGLCIRLQSWASVNLFILNYINAVFILVFLTIIAILISNDFFYSQKKKWYKNYWN
ncbi:hypothetical protein SGLAD_v1c02440 [Spiroplasma gladiatoris]|uniref:Uncharacterized protein n=1 Tax=Spiroplasma gladiatoris TaxID=2143 RepID=A0A4P7AIB4_9MOLU|nr:hypothetical protein [Spiroplasma gladiatoris]QBQ07443.1 hypothetical protein SGLAD_v1c02440 [Spiroplasma gladiatoris]